MPRRKRTDEEKRTDLVYEAERVAGVSILRPLLNVGEAQYLVDFVLKTRWWKGLCGIRQIKVEYVPRWEVLSEMADRRTTGNMTLTMGNMTEGVIYHELSHCARGDTDNSHPPEFLEMHIDMIARFYCSVAAEKYRQELHIRKVL